MNEWQAFLLALSAAGSVVAAVLSWTVKLRWSEGERRNKEAQIALIHETVKEKDAHIAGFQERVRAKDDLIDLYKSLSAKNVVEHIEAQERLHQREIEGLQGQLRESESKSGNEIAALQERLHLAEVSLIALAQAGAALDAERRHPAFLSVSGSMFVTPPSLALLEEERQSVEAGGEDNRRSTP